MELILTLILTIFMLFFAVANSIFVGFPLLICTGMIAWIAFKKGHSPSSLIDYSKKGAKKALLVLRIFVLIGAITGIWTASGTVPSLVYYGIELINPHYFILYAFLLTSLVSFLIGTSFGTVGTIGIALMLIARSGEVDLNVTAGAIMAGAYFGDRCSPMSSSANLVAHLTETDLYKNIKLMFKTATVPLLFTLVAYAYLSGNNPLSASSISMGNNIQNSFDTHWITLIPAASILFLALLRVGVKLSMGISICLAGAIAFFLQGQSLIEIVKIIVFGFRLQEGDPLQSILIGGGILSMWKAIFIVFFSSILASILEHTRLLESLESILGKARSRLSIFTTTSFVAVLTAAVGCNQAISIFLTEQLMRNAYKRNNRTTTELAIDIENTSVLFAALIPWNIAALVPTSTLNVSPAGFIPFAVYLYLVPLWQMMTLLFKKPRQGA